MTPKALDARNVHFSFAAQEILHGVDVQLNAGEFLGLIGPNGSGKTTLLKVLCGVLHPQSGAVFLHGKNLSQLPLPEKAQQLAVVPQETHFAFPMEVLDVVLLGRLAHRKGFFNLALEGEHDIDIARRALAAVDLTGFEHRCVTDLSGGEKQRVVVASALAQEASVLLLDEPTAFLDLNHQAQLCRLLKGLTRKGFAVAAVFHDLNLASLFCDRLIALKEGVIDSSGAPAQMMNTALLQRVFGVHGAVQISPATGLPYYLPQIGDAL